ncbi:MAG: hypothetical protein WBG46_14245 [Nonlabens sp.]
MKATKIIFILLCFALMGCDEDDNRNYSNENGRFVRFFLQTDRDNDPLEFPQIELGIRPIAVYEKENFATLKIPVALTSTPLTETVNVDFEPESQGLNNIEISPVNQLSFSATQLVDTVFIKINERWDSAATPFLKLKLTGVSDSEIQLGVPNSENPLDEIRINFNEVVPTYGIESLTRVDVIGGSGEMYRIDVGFPDGFIEDEVDQELLLNEIQSNFDYELTPLPITSSQMISYSFEVQEIFTDEDLLYKTTLALSDIIGYDLDGFPLVSFRRDPITPRDPALNTAANFYDTNDQFYRLYGVHWNDFNDDGICEWRDFNSFAVPVEVDSDDPNAVLGDDQGTADTSDDIYFHAFRIGFEPPTNSTTNPFNLKRWFTNESTSRANSPGFNIVPAMEFFPDADQSTISGTVQVIEQTIQVGTTASNGSIRQFITISGSGTYSEIAPGIVDIEFTLNATNNDLFGGTRTAYYHLYNTSNFTDPADISESCFQAIPIQ